MELFDFKKANSLGKWFGAMGKAGRTNSKRAGTPYKNYGRKSR